MKSVGKIASHFSSLSLTGLGLLRPRPEEAQPIAESAAVEHRCICVAPGFPTLLEEVCHTLLRYEEYWSSRSIWLITSLQHALHSVVARPRVTGRLKTVHSTLMKMCFRGTTVSELSDLVGLRVLVDEVPECYRALNIIHHFWRPIEGLVDDYIRFPKTGGYQSLHTTIQLERNLRVEIQIRTRRMHDVIENGALAQYKQSCLRSADVCLLEQSPGRLG